MGVRLADTFTGPAVPSAPATELLVLTVFYVRQGPCRLRTPPPEARNRQRHKDFRAYVSSSLPPGSLRNLRIRSPQTTSCHPAAVTAQHTANYGCRPTMTNDP